MSDVEQRPGLNRTAQIIGEVKGQIVADAEMCVVPWTVTGFSQLHEYVDANMYLEYAGQVYVHDDEASLAEINLIEEAVTAWLALGRLADMQPIRITWINTERYALEQPAGEWREQLGVPAGTPLTVDTVDDDYLAEIEVSDMCVGIDGRVVDDVEPQGRRERVRHDPDDVADLVAHDAAAGLPGFTPVPRPPAEGSPEWAVGVLMALTGDERAAAVTVAGMVELALARRCTYHPGGTDWTRMARSVAWALIDSVEGAGVANEADTLLRWWRGLSDEERALTGVDLAGTVQVPGGAR